MGHLCYIANHTKKVRIGNGKFRELLFANYGDILIHLLFSNTLYFQMGKSPDDWSCDKLEVICDSDMEKWEQYYPYKDMTDYYYNMFKDSIGENI